MKVIQFRQPGPPHVLELVEAPLPQPRDNELLVRAHAIGVGIPDLMVRSGTYAWMPPLPAIPGIEMSGTIESIGPGATGFSVGQKVIVSGRERPHRGGCYAQFIIARPNELFVLPDSVDLDAAAALANYQVAWHLIHSAARARRGDTILIHAAAGGVGSATVELANVAGLEVTAVASSDAKLAFARAQGARHGIDRSREQVATRALDITSGRGFDIIVDPIGGPAMIDNIALLAPLGLLLSYGQLAGPPSGDLLGAMNRRAGASPAVRRFSMHSFDDQPQRRAEAMTAVIADLCRGAIRPRIHARLPLPEAARAHELLAGGQVIGKLLLTP